jgi:two-component system, chemotaxis family, response regulator Rcp1
MEAAAGQIEIFLAEDSLVDVQILQRYLQDVAFPYHLSVVRDGEAALASLERQAPYTAAPRPDLILLDIYLPKKSGWEVLEWLRATPALATIPVVMLTGILAPSDEQERDRLQPAHCLVKPTAVEEYRDLVKILEEVMSQHNAWGPPR